MKFSVLSTLRILMLASVFLFMTACKSKGGGGMGGGGPGGGGNGRPLGQGNCASCNQGLDNNGLPFGFGDVPEQSFGIGLGGGLPQSDGGPVIMHGYQGPIGGQPQQDPSQIPPAYQLGPAQRPPDGVAPQQAERPASDQVATSGDYASRDLTEVAPADENSDEE